MPAKTHGAARAKWSLGQAYRAWGAMKERCLNPSCPSYVWYGARGISVYSGWVDSFEAFLVWVGLPPSPHHSLDRVYNDGNYDPGNVRWATIAEQNANKRQGNQAPVLAVAVRHEVHALAKQGLSTRQIATKLGLSKSYAHRIVRGDYDEA